MPYIGGFAPTKESLPWTLRENYPKFYKEGCWKTEKNGSIIYTYNNKSGDWKHYTNEDNQYTSLNLESKLNNLLPAQGNTRYHKEVDSHFPLFPAPLSPELPPGNLESSFSKYMTNKHGCRLTLGNGLEIKKSPGKGYGLFVTQDVSKGSVITWYDGHDVLNMAPNISSSTSQGKRSTRRNCNVRELTEEKKKQYDDRKNWFLAISKTNSPIIVGYTSSDYVRDPRNPAWKEAGIMSFANSVEEGGKANCKRDTINKEVDVALKINKDFELKEGIVILRAKHEIKSGSELLFNYPVQD